MKKNLYSIKIVNLLFLFILIIILEVGARLFIYFTRGSSTTGISERTLYLKYQPFVMFGLDWDAILPLTQNLNNNIEDSNNFPYRILLLGGSTAADYPIHLLEEALKKKFPRYRFKVINAAYGAYNARQELVVAAIWGVQLKPNMIITLDGANDLTHRLSMEKPGTFFLNSAYELAISKPFLSPFLDLLRHSQFIQGLRRLNARISIASTPQYIDAIPTYISAQHSINILAKGLSAKRIIILQPFIAFKNPLSESENKFTHYKYRENAIKDLYNIMNEQLKLLSERDNALYVDGRFIFDRLNYTVFSDDVHFVNDDGYRLLSEYIISFINEEDIKNSSIE